MENFVTKNKILLFVFAEAILLSGFVLTMAWLWDRWLIPGPHGSIRWIGMDFVPYWVGVRAMLNGQSPYNPGTTQTIQSILLGGPPEIGGDPMMFVYPAWIFLLLVPWALLPLRWAVALWTGLLLFGALHLIGFLAIRWGATRPRATAFWALVLTVGGLPFLVISASKGQLGLVSLGALMLVNRLWKRHEMAAGIVLGLATLKPTLTVIPTLGFLLWAVMERKYRLLVGFAACMGILFLSSWLAVGNWIPDYLKLISNTGGAPILWSLAILPWPWKALYTLFFAGLVVYAFIILRRTRNQPQWFSATVLAGLALFPMRWIYDLLLGILVPAEARDLRGGLAISVVIALVVPWGLTLFQPSLRWSAYVVGLPLAWAIVWLVQFIYARRKRR